MRREGKLWPALISLENLFGAAHAAALGKRRKPEVADFLMNLEQEVLRLRDDLVSGRYYPGPYRSFMVHDPKPRHISAAAFRDRVVHHALTRVLEPIFERRFTAHSYACRKAYGVHRALDHASASCPAFPYVLKCDVRKYFATMDHEILNSLLARGVKCGPTLDLAARIIAASNPQEEVIFYFPGDDLFTPLDRRRGLPLGNQTSQFFANVYLNPLDHFVARELKPGAYMRYVDDFLLFAENKRALAEMRFRIEERLAALRLILHPRKSRVYRTTEGVTFLGWRLFPGHRRLAAGSVARFCRRMRRLQMDFAAGRVDFEKTRASVMAWIGHAGHGNTWRLREKLFARYPFRQGAGPDRARRRLEQQFEEQPRLEP